MDRKEQIIDPYEDDLEEDEPQGIAWAAIVALSYVVSAFQWLHGLACSIFRRRS